MPDFPQNINDNLLGNIVYRENVVTGTITVDNGNYTYDVFIAGEKTAIKYVHTNQKYPEFSTGDSVLLNLEYGSKDMPIIIGYAKKIVQDEVEVDINVLVTTLDAYTITTNSAYLEGRVEDIDGYENVTRQGFYYGLTTGYGSDIYTTGSFAVGAYNEYTTGLTAETTYHYQAYVYDADGDVQTGDNKSLTTSAAAVGDIYITYWNVPSGSEVGYIKSFKASNGASATSWTALDYQLIYNGACVDSAGNIYYIALTQPNHTLVKYSNSGAELKRLIVSYQALHIAIGDDGFIYTLENTQTDNAMMTKRNATTLAEISSFQMDLSHTYYGLSFYDDVRYYVVNSNDDDIELWRYDLGGEQADVAVTSSKTTLSSLAVAGTTVLGTDYANQPWEVPTNLSTGETDWSIGISRCFGVTSKGGYFYVLGNNSNGGKIYLGKYNESGVQQWLVEAVSSTGYYPASVAAWPF